MSAAPRDRLLRWLVGMLAGVTAVSMVSSLAGVELRPPWAGLDGLSGWLAVAWPLLVVAVAVRAAAHVRHLGRLVSDRDEHLQGLAAASHEWLWESTPDLVATYCSRGAAELTGRTPEQIVGHYLGDFIAEEDHPLVAQELAAAVAERRGWEDIELRWLHLDGHTVVLQGSAVPVLDRRGRVTGFRGVRRGRPLGEPTAELARIRTRVAALAAAGGPTIALQPIISVTTGRLAGVEALSRFPDGKPADGWFADAARAGVGVELELLAVQAALTLLPHLPDPTFLSLNTSPTLITDPRLYQTISNAAAPLHRVVLELTEHVQVGSYDHVKTALEPLRARGVRLAIDDTGAGYASFSHVLALRPDTIKLDRSVITDIETDPARRALITAIVLLGLELGACITAEGIETIGELDTLANLGIDQAQGYLLARPETDPQQWATWHQHTWPTGRPAQ